jgi:hypothetical protein
MSELPTRGVRLVSQGSGRTAEVFDLETGEKLLNVYRIQLDFSRPSPTVVLHLDTPFVYEGPAQIVETALEPALPADSGDDDQA